MQNAINKALLKTGKATLYDLAVYLCRLIGDMQQKTIIGVHQELIRATPRPEIQNAIIEIIGGF
jgi:hypothetical protein